MRPTRNQSSGRVPREPDAAEPLISIEGGFRLRLEPTDRTPAYIQFERQVRTAVADGSLKQDERLPSVRRTAQELRVSTSTVARAYAALARAGVLASRPGGGSAVASRERLDQPGLRRQRRERIRPLARQITVRAMALG
jgi:DNA-binding transcriptional regulator YhcF (GntR family)